jgi:hypothetical protein
MDTPAMINDAPQHPAADGRRRAGSANARARALPAAVRAAALLGILALSGAVRAQEQPLGFTFGPGETVTHDSNVLRVPSSIKEPGGTSDTYSLTSLTGALHEIYGREDLTASATLGRVLYKRLKDLDYTQQDIHGTLRSNLPLSVDASISASHTAALAHFADFTGTAGGLPARNVITHNDVNGFVDAPFAVDWRVLVGGDGQQSRNSNDTFKSQDFNSTQVNGGIRYQPTTGNTVDLLVRSTSATYINGSPAAFVGPGYRDNGADLSADWTFAGASHLHGRAGYLKHTGDDHLFPNPGGATPFVEINRNFSGPAFDLTYLWEVTAITRLKFYGLRQSGAAGDNNYLSAVTHTYRITPTYLPTAKTEIDAYAESSRRNYFTSVLVNTPVNGQTIGGPREDNSHSFGLTALWTPRRWVQLTLDLHRDIRDSTVNAFSYTDSVASLQVQGTF